MCLCRRRSMHGTVHSPERSLAAKGFMHESDGCQGERRFNLKAQDRGHSCHDVKSEKKSSPPGSSCTLLRAARHGRRPQMRLRAPAGGRQPQRQPQDQPKEHRPRMTGNQRDMQPSVWPPSLLFPGQIAPALPRLPRLVPSLYWYCLQV